MSIRKKGRNSFIFKGRLFSWWIDDETYLRIASVDKKFIIAIRMWGLPDDQCVIEVIGEDFPGLSSSDKRPVLLKTPELLGHSMGNYIEHILEWSLSPTKKVIRISGPA